MRRSLMTLVGATVMATALAIGTIGVAMAQSPGGMGHGPMTGQQGPMHGPGSGQNGPEQGQGPMGGPNGAGCQGQGGMMGGPAGPGVQGAALNSLDDAQKAFQSFLAGLNNADLALDEVMEFQWNYYAIVKEQSTGNGAFELLANRQNGAVFLEPGPAMMWNTKYGHLAGNGGMMGGGMMGGGMMGGPTNVQPSQPPTVTADQARQLAQQWLDTSQAGSTTEAPDAFPGYYTVHIVKDGQITGMLSVNAYSGQVWYHTWHGQFVGMSEVD